MARGVDEVELVFDAIEGAVGHVHRLALDGDAALALQLHLVEELRLHVLRADGSGDFEEAVGQGGLAVVDVGDDAEIADVLLVHDGNHGSTGRMGRQLKCRMIRARSGPALGRWGCAGGSLG